MTKKTKEGEDLVTSALTILKKGLTVFTQAKTDGFGNPDGFIISRDEEVTALGRYVEVSHPFEVNGSESIKVSEFSEGAVVANHFVINNPENDEVLAGVIVEFLGVRESVMEETAEEADEKQDAQDDKDVASYHAMKEKMPDATADEIAAAVFAEEQAEKEQVAITSKAEKEGKL